MDTTFPNIKSTVSVLIASDRRSMRRQLNEAKDKLNIAMRCGGSQARL
ncbi:hypothetical protein [Paraburkholderia sp. C35]|nr:hypothetical protein [Paraburkholderia sp. C35]